MTSDDLQTPCIQDLGSREIPATQWAHAYKSAFTETPAVDTVLLSHLNCSYFSSSGLPPTLLGLKRHAQSLAILIKQLSVSTEFCIVDARDRIKGHRAPTKYLENEAFDYLTDLSKPYDNDDEWHNVPLNTLANSIARQTHLGVVHNCPLSSARLVSVDAKGAKARPYCNHQLLAEHANDCLEILDHELSATGGLQSLLPTDHASDKKAMEFAQNTILGQFLLFQQALVGRMHELELAYANALDTLKGEAAVPLQALSKATSSGGGATGRLVAYPQDRWVLCDAGDDTFEFIHKVLDKQEALIEPKEEAWRQAGVVGERMWRENRGGALYEAGLVAWDVKTRFIRMRGKTRSPIFILPAHGEHPAVAETRKLEESKPTVVTVRTPVWPAPVSAWERKYQAKLEKARETEQLNDTLTTQNLELSKAKKLHEDEIRGLRESVGLYEAFYGVGPGEANKKAPPEIAKKIQAVMQYKTRNKVYKKMWEMVYTELPAELHAKLDKVYDEALQQAADDEGDIEQGDEIDFHEDFDFMMEEEEEEEE